MDIQIINLTNHDINYLPNEVVDIFTSPVKNSDVERLKAKSIVIPSSGHAKVEIGRDGEVMKLKIKGTSKQCIVNYSHIGQTSGLPPEQDNTIYIVSQLVFNSICHIRKDVYQIDRPIRTESGRVVACKAFSRMVYADHSLPLKKVSDFLGENSKYFPDQVKFLKILSSLNKFIEK